MEYERVRSRGLHWRLHPNGGRVAGVAVPKDEAAGLIARGWLRIQGERAVIDATVDEEAHNTMLRIVFDRPYPYPHP